MAKPKYPARLQADISYKMRDEIKAFAKHVDLSVSEIVRRSVDYYLSTVKELNKDDNGQENKT